MMIRNLRRLLVSCIASSIAFVLAVTGLPFAEKAVAQTTAIVDTAFDSRTMTTSYIEASVRDSTLNVTLPEFRDGALPITYTLSPSLPLGVTFNAATRLLSGTIQGTSEDDTGARTYTYTAIDARSILRRHNIILVITDEIPDFGEETIDNISAQIGTAFTEVTLPESTTGSGTVTYALDSALPTGLDFNAQTRVISATNLDDVEGSQSVESAPYTYTATDEDGDTAAMRTFAIEVVDAMPVAPNVPTYTFTNSAPATDTVLPPFTTTTTHNPELTYSVSALPMGLTFTAETRTISGMPNVTATLPDTTMVTYTATDGVDSENTTFNINIISAVVPIFAATIPDIELTVGVAIPQDAPITLPAVSNLSELSGAPTYNVSPALPDDLDFNITTRQITGMVTGTSEDDTGTRTYIYTVTDTNLSTTRMVFNLVITDKLPSISPMNIKPDTLWVAGEEPSGFGFNISGGNVEGNGNYTVESSPALPSGITLTSSGNSATFNGTPSAPFASREITVTVTDDDGDTASYSFNLTVEADALPVAPRPAQNLVFAVGTSIDQVLLPFSGGNGDLTYELSTSSVALPQGLTFDASTRRITGEITDTAMDQNAGARTYTYEAEDSDGDTETATFTIAITDAIPVAPTVENLRFRQRIAISSTVPFSPFTSTTDHNPALTYSLTASGGGALPSWLRFDEETRIIHGSTANDIPLSPPPTVGAFAVAYTATDGQDSTSAIFHIIITPNTIPTPPTIDNGGYTFAVGEEVDVTLPEFMGGDGIITHSLTDGTSPVISLVGGLTFTLADRTISGTVAGTANNDDSDNATYTYSASDIDGDTDSLTFTIDITDVRPDFGTATIGDIPGFQNSAITDVTLPEVATPGTGDTTYSLTPALPAGLVFDADTRVLSGTPSVHLETAAEFSYIATDEDGDTPTDESGAPAPITFNITVEQDLMPIVPTESLTFVFQPGADLTGAMAITLPVFTGGNTDNTPLMYEVEVPTNLQALLTADNTARTITGTLAADLSKSDNSFGPLSAQYTAIDEDGDRVEATYTIEVVDFLPVAVVNVPDYDFVAGAAVPGTAGTTGMLGQQLPEFMAEATSSAAAALTPPTLMYDIINIPTLDAERDAVVDLVGGLMFDEATRVVYGTPTISATEAENMTTYTYRVYDGVDEAGDVAGDVIGDQFVITIVNAAGLQAPAVPYYVFTEGQDLTGTMGVELPEFMGGNDDLMYSITDANDMPITATEPTAIPLAAGLSINPNTRVITGIVDLMGNAANPADDSIENLRFTYSATDSATPAVTGSTTFEITVLDAMPEFEESIEDINVAERQEDFTRAPFPISSSGTGSITYDLTLNDLARTALPAEKLRFNASTRELTILANVTIDMLSLRYTATDADGDFDEEIFNIVVTEDLMPMYSPTSEVVNVVAGEERTFTFQQLAGDSAGTPGVGFPTYEVSETGGSGMYALGLMLRSVSTGGELYGQIEDTPDDDTANNSTPNGPVQISVTATDSDGDSDTFTYNFIVTDHRPVVPASINGGVPLRFERPQAITPIQLPAFTHEATPAPDLTYSATGLPDGLALSTRGMLTGAPTELGSHTVTYIADDGADRVSTTFMINVVDELPDFNSMTVNDITVRQNERLTQMTLPQLIGGMGTVVYSLTPPLPQGLSFDANTRVLSGTPTVPLPTTTYTYRATDTAGQTDSTTFNITVTEDLVPSYSPTANRTITLTPGATIDSADVRFPSLENRGDLPYTTTITPAMADFPNNWLMFDADTRAFSGFVPNDRAGDDSIAPFTVTQTLRDRDFDVASVTFTFVVIDTMPIAPTAAIPDYEVSTNQRIQGIVLPPFTNVADDNPEVMQPDLIYSITAQDGGAHPSWMNFNSRSRVISGRPTTAGTTSLTYIATDGGDSAMKNFNLVVVDDARPVTPAILNGGFEFGLSATVDITLPPFVGGTGALTHRLTDGPPTPTNDVTTLIGGLSYDSTNRRIHGTINITDRAENDSLNAVYYYSATDTDSMDSDTVSIPITIAIVDDVPSFGPSVAPNIAIQQHNSMAPVILPEATSGMGTLVYSLSPSLPQGLSFNADATIRQVTGTPLLLSEVTTYTYRVTDAVGDFAELTFTITVTEDLMPSYPAGSDQFFTLAPGQIISTTQPDALRISFPSLSDDGAVLGDEPHSDPMFTGANLEMLDWIALQPSGSFSGTAPTDDGTDNSVAPFTVIQTVTDADGDEASVTITIEVVDPVPTMPRESIPNYQFAAGVLIDPIVLPTFATRADGNPLVASPMLTYSLTEDGETTLPSGLSFDDETRTLSGTPAPATPDPITLSYTATESLAPADMASVTFTIEVLDATTALVAPVIPNGGYVFSPGQTVNVTLPAFTGGTAPITYSLLSDGTAQTALDSGLTFNPSRLIRTISGTIPTDGVGDDSSTATYTYRATDSATDAAGEPDPNMKEITFTIAIVDDLPSFGTATVDDISIRQHSALSAMTLPIATGGSGTLAYRIFPKLMAGISLDPATRILSGTPLQVQSETTYTYIAEDAIGDRGELTFTITVTQDLIPSFGADADRTFVLIPGQRVLEQRIPDLIDNGNEPLVKTVVKQGNFIVQPSGGSTFVGYAAPADTSADDSGGPYTYTQTVTDADGDTASVTFTVVVIDSVPTVPKEDIPDYEVTLNQTFLPIFLPAFATSVDDHPNLYRDPDVPPPGLTYTLIEQGRTTLPSWIQFDPSRRAFFSPLANIDGSRPSELGITNLTYRATDSGGDTAFVNFSVGVKDDPRPVSPFVAFGFRESNWFIGAEFTVFTLEAFKGGNRSSPGAPLTYELRRDGDLITEDNPPYRGLTWNPETRQILGTVEGTPVNDNQRFTLVYSATDTDADGMHDTVSHRINVIIRDAQPRFDFEAANLMAIQLLTRDNGPDLCQVCAATIDSILQFAPFSLPAFPTATGGTGGTENLTYSFRNLPPGLTFDPATRTLGGRATAFGEFISEYVATDEDGDEGIIRYTFNITENLVPRYAAGSNRIITLIPGETIGDVIFPLLDPEMPGNVPTVPMIDPMPDTNGMFAAPWDWLTLDTDDGLTFSGMAPAMNNNDDSLAPFEVTRTETDDNGAGESASVTYTFEVVDFLPLRPEMPIDPIIVAVNQQIPNVVLPRFISANDNHPRVDSPRFGIAISEISEQGRVLEPPPWVSAALILLDDGGAQLFGRPNPDSRRGKRTLRYSADHNDAGVDFDSGAIEFVINVVVDLRPVPPTTIPDGGYTFSIGMDGTVPSLPRFTEGNGELTYDLKALDADGNELTEIPTELGLSFNRNTRTITFTSPTDTAGDDSIDPVVFKYSATDSDPAGVATEENPELGPDTTSITFPITIVDDLPRFTTTTVDPISVIETRPLSSAVTLPVATGGTGQITYSVSDNFSETGLDFTTRVISGTAAAGVGSTEITYTATDTVGEFSELTFTVAIEENLTPSFPEADRIITLEPGDTVNEVFRLTEANGSVGNSCPPGESGCAVSSIMRVVSPVPDASGMFAEPWDWLIYNHDSRTFTGTVPADTDANQMLADFEVLHSITDYDGETTTVTYTFRVVDAMPTAPRVPIPNYEFALNHPITPITLPEFATNVDDNPDVAAPRLNYSLVGDEGVAFPSGLKYHIGSRTLFGTPDAAGSTILRFMAMDDGGDAAAVTFTVTVASDTLPVAPTQTQAFTFAVGQAKTVTLAEFTRGNGEITYALMPTPALPDGLEFVAASREITGTISDTAGDDSVIAATYSYTATDMDGDPVTATFTITVVDPQPHAPSETKAFVFEPGEMIVPSTTDQSTTANGALPAFSGGDGNLRYAFGGGSDLPVGVSFSDEPLGLIGMIEPDTEYDDSVPLNESSSPPVYTYTATDAGGDSVSTTFTIQIIDPKPVAQPVTNRAFTVGVAIPDISNPNNTLPVFPTNVDAIAEIDAPTLTYRLTDADGVEISPTNLLFVDPTDPTTGVNFDSTTRQFSGTPGVDGMTTVTYTVSDGEDEVSAMFDIIVSLDPVPQAPEIPNGGYTFRPGEVVELTLPIYTGGNIANGPLIHKLTLGDSTADGTPDGPPIDSDNPLFGGTLGERQILGLTFDPATRLLSGTVSGTSGDDDGFVRVTYSATDSDPAVAPGVEGNGPDTTSFAFTITRDDSQPLPPGSDPQQAFVWEVRTDLSDLERIERTLAAFTEVDPPLTYEITGELPGGISFDAATGEFTGDVTGSDAVARADYTYTATDVDGDVSEESEPFTIEIIDTVPEFSVDTLASITVVQGSPITPVQLPVATSGSGTLTYSIPNLPAGLMFEDDPEEVEDFRFLSGTPTEVLIETTFMYRVEDADGDQDSIDFTITVEDDITPMLPTVSAPLVLEITPGQNLTTDPFFLPEFVRSDGMPNSNGMLTYTITPDVSVEIPGLRFDAETPAIRGIVVDDDTDQDKAPITFSYFATDDDNTRDDLEDLGFTATDDDEDSDPLTFTIAVRDPKPEAPSQTQSFNIPVGPDEVSVTLADFMFDGDGDLTYALVTSSTDPTPPDLPGTLELEDDSLTITGVVTDTADNPIGSVQYFYSAMDPGGDTETATFTLVFMDDVPEVPDPIEDITVTVGMPFEMILDPFTGGDGVLMYALDPTPSLPAGLIFDDASGSDTFRAIKGTIVDTNGNQDADPVTYTYTATDAGGDSVSTTFNLLVIDPRPVAPTIIPRQNLVIFEQFDPIELPAFTYLHDSATPTPLRITLTPDVPGLTFTASEAARRITIDGRPRNSRPDTVTYMATDGIDSAMINFDIVVSLDPMPRAPFLPNNHTYTFTPGQMLPNVVGAPGAVQLLPFTIDDGTDGTHLVYRVGNLDSSNIFDSSNDLIGGLTFDPATRLIHGEVPATSGDDGATQTYIYQATDTDMGAAANEHDIENTDFTITILDEMPTFASGAMIEPITAVVGSPIPPVTLDAVELNPDGTAPKGTGEITYSLTPALPTGLVFDANTRIISGTPTAVPGSDPNTFTDTFTYMARDTDGDTTRPLTFDIIVEADRPPVVPQITPPFVYLIGQAEQTVDRTLPDFTGGNGMLTYTFSDEADLTQFGLSYDEENRRISGTIPIPADMAGNDSVPTPPDPLPSFTYRATDDDNTLTDIGEFMAADDDESAQTSFTIQFVDAIPVAPAVEINDFTTGINNEVILPAFTTTADTVDGLQVPALNYSLTLVDGTPRPDWIGFDTDDPESDTYLQLSGNPTVATPSDAPIMLRYTASDGADSDFVDFPLSVSVTDVTRPIPAEFTRSYSYAVGEENVTLPLPIFTGDDGPFTYSLTDAEGNVIADDGELILGLTYSTTSTSSASGTISGTVTGTNADDTTVDPVMFTYTATETMDPDGTQEFRGITFTIAITDAVPDFTGEPSYDINTIAGSSIIPGILTTPATPEESFITLPETTGTATEDNPITYALSPADISTRVPGLSFDPLTREITGIPSAPAVEMFTYTATDNDGDSDTLTFNITVAVDLMLTVPIVANLDYVVGPNAIVEEVTLPEFTGGNRSSPGATLTYRLTDANGNTIDNGTHSLIGDLRYNQESRVISVDIDADSNSDDSIEAVFYTYTATDIDGDMVPLTFSIQIDDVIPLAPGVGTEQFARDRAFTPVVLPAFATTDDPNTPNVSFTHTLSDSNGVEIHNTNNPLIANLMYNAASRTISGPPNGLAPATDYIYTATDGADSATDTLTLSVVIDPEPVAPVIPNGGYSFAVREVVDLTLPDFAGGDTPLTYTLTPTDLPGDLMFDATNHRIHGTILGDDTDNMVPAREYTYTAVDNSKDDTPEMDAVPFNITITDAMPAFASDAEIDPITGTEGTAITPTDPLPAVETAGTTSTTYTFDPELPDGLDFEVDPDSPNFRVISGTPTSGVSETTYAYIATDADGDEARRIEFTITIESYVDTPPVAPTVPNFTFTAGQTVNETLPIFTGGNGPLTYSLRNDADGVITETNRLFVNGSTLLGAGVGFNPQTRELSGTVIDGATDNSVPTTTYTYSATDSDLPEGSDPRGGDGPETISTTFTITVEDDNLVLPTVGNMVFTLNQVIDPAVELPAVTRPATSDRIVYTLDPAPPNAPFQGLTFNASTRILGGTPMTVTPDPVPVTYTATHSDTEETVSVEFTINIESEADTPPVAPAIPNGGYTFTAGDNLTGNNAITLPEFTGGNGVLTYSLSGDDGNAVATLVGGLIFNPDPNIRTISGTLPDDSTDNSVATTTYTYSATDDDSDGDDETESTTFTITVEDDNLDLPAVANMMFTLGQDIGTVQLPTVTTPNTVDMIDYTLAPALPEGLSFSDTLLRLTGAPSEVTPTPAPTYTYTATHSVTGEEDETTFTISVFNVPSLEDVTASAIPTVGANIALVASQAISSRVELALDRLSSGIDISTLDGPSFKLNPQQQNGGSSGSPVRFGVWYSAASDSLSDSRGDVSWSGTTDSTNLGFDVGFDISEKASLVVGILQNSASTSATYSFTSGGGSSSTLSIDLDSTAFYVGLGYDWLDAWFATGSADSTLTDSMRPDMAIPASFSYLTFGLTADFEIIDSLRIGGKAELLTSDLSLSAMDGEFTGISTDSLQLRTAFVANYQLELGEKGNGLLVPKFEFGFRDLSLGSSISGPTTAAGGSAMETGFGVDYTQRTWGLTVGLDIRSISVANYSADSTQWQVRWDSGNYGSGLSFQLTPRTVSESLGGIDSLYSGGYNQYQSLLERQRGGNNAAADSKGMDFEVGYGIAAGLGTFTPYLKTTNFRGIGSRTEEFGIRYQTLLGLELSITASATLTPQTVEILGLPITLTQQESAVTFSTRYSF